jgi:hypothetical protein
MTAREFAGRRVYLCATAGPFLAEDRNLSDLIGELFSDGARFVAIPLERLGPDFLRLASGVAGRVLQKLVNYRIQVAVLGDVSAAEAASVPLRDFVRESNRGTTVWFVPDIQALEVKLALHQPK